MMSNSDPIIVCEALREQNDALRQELHDIRQEMDEITDQFRTEDAEEFKQLQAELEMAAKNCRILQFKLRKSEKRNETIETDKALLEEKMQQIIRDNNRARDFDEELLIAKEVSVRLHSELEKSEESRLITEKLNMALRQHLDTLKESLDEQLIQDSTDDYPLWQLSVCLYEALFREYVLMEELSWLQTKNLTTKNSSDLNTNNNNNGNDLSDLMNSYQHKISALNSEISNLKHDITSRDKELSQLRVQYKILKQRSQSADRNSNSLEDVANNDRSRRGVSVDGGGNLREQLEASLDEIRLLKNKLLRSEDDVNNATLEKESLLAKLDEQSKQGVDDTVNKSLQIFMDKIDYLIILIKENKIDEKVVVDLQQFLRSSRWSKQLTEEQLQTQSAVTKSTEKTSEIVQHANELMNELQTKKDILDKIRYRLTNLTYDTNDTCSLLEELDKAKKTVDEKQQMYNNLQKSFDNLQISSKKSEEQLQSQLNKNQTLEKNFEQQKSVNNELQQENTRLSSLNAKQLHDLKHLEQLRQSILTFEKKLDQKQTRVNELSMKIIEKEDIIETKVKECQKHRLELRELETKYYTLGKQLEEQILAMTKEMEKLNVEKEMLRFDLESIRLNQKNDRPASARSTAEDQIARVKAECNQQIIEGEVECYKLRINQLTNEKDDLLKTIKDLEKRCKELQIKRDVNEQSWLRLKADTSEKQRKYDESIKIKSELQNAVDRLRQKLYDLESYAQDKQNKHAIDRHQWEIERLELVGKINELEEQLSKVTKRQRKDLETVWKKERNELQKQLQQSQQSLKDLQKQVTNREAPSHVTEKINVLMTENELLLNKIKELENVVDDVQLLKNEMQRLRDKNSSDWNYWRKQQSDLYAQLRQQQFIKESILNKFDRLQKQIRSGNDHDRCIRDLSVGPISLNSLHNETAVKLSHLNSSHETLPDDIELPHGTIDIRSVSVNEIAGTVKDFTLLPMSLMTNDKQHTLKNTYSAQEHTAASLDEIGIKLERVEDNLFSYRRFMDFIRAKSEKSGSIARDDSMNNIATQTMSAAQSKRLASAPPENVNLKSQRRSRFDANGNTSQEHIPSSLDETPSSELLTNSVMSPATSTKNRFFSLSRRFRFRTQSPEKNPTTSASVHFLDEDIDLETKERTTKKSVKPSKGILKSLRHRSPFRFRSKDAVIIEQEPSPPPPTPTQAPPPPPPPPPQPTAKSTSSKETKQKASTVTSTKHRGRFIELKKATTKTSSSNGTPKKIVNVTPIIDTPGSSLVRRASGLKDLIHKFEVIPPKPKRVTIDNESSTGVDQDEKINSNHSIDDQHQHRPPTLTSTQKSKTIDIPDLLQNVEKESSSTLTKPILRHSNSSRQTASFDSAASMVSASESITTIGSSTRKPTSTARPLMLSANKEESS
ncbi:unnamed protein product [Rotaria magnacalcarata]|nr:unnamed protein product [Rotaria magnacalcarata]